MAHPEALLRCLLHLTDDNVELSDKALNEKKTQLHVNVSSGTHVFKDSKDTFHVNMSSETCLYSGVLSGFLLF